MRDATPKDPSAPAAPDESRVPHPASYPLLTGHWTTRARDGRKFRYRQGSGARSCACGCGCRR